MLLSGRLSWDKDEDKFVFNLIQPHANDDYYGRTWLGGSCLHGHGGGWKWDDGTPWDYENWNQGRFCATISCNTYTYTFPWLESRPQNVWAWGTFDSVKGNYHDTFTQLWCFIPFFIKVVLIDAAGQGDQICNGSYDCVSLGADASDLLPHKWNQSVCDSSKVFDCICKKPFNLYTHFMWRLISWKIVRSNPNLRMHCLSFHPSPKDPIYVHSLKKWFYLQEPFFGGIFSEFSGVFFQFFFFKFVWSIFPEFSTKMKWEPFCLSLLF